MSFQFARIVLCFFVISNSAIIAQWQDKGSYLETVSDFGSAEVVRIVISDSSRLFYVLANTQDGFEIREFNYESGSLLRRTSILSSDYHQLYACDLSKDGQSYCVQGTRKTEQNADTMFVYVFSMQTNSVIRRFTDKYIDQKVRNAGSGGYDPKATVIHYGMQDHRLFYSIRNDFGQLTHKGSTHYIDGTSSMVDLSDSSKPRVLFTHGGKFATNVFFAADNRSLIFYASRMCSSTDPDIPCFGGVLYKVFVDDNAQVSILDSIGSGNTPTMGTVMSRDASLSFWTNIFEFYRYDAPDKRMTEHYFDGDNSIDFIGLSEVPTVLAIGSRNLMYFYNSRTMQQLDTHKLGFDLSGSHYALANSTAWNQVIFCSENKYLRKLTVNYDAVNSVESDNSLLKSTPSLEVLPTPTSTVVKLNICLPKTQEATVTVYSAADQKKMTQVQEQLHAGCSELILDVSSLQNGVYSVVLVTEREHCFSKIIVLH